jgi:hypothetical protein
MFETIEPRARNCREPKLSRFSNLPYMQALPSSDRDAPFRAVLVGNRKENKEEEKIIRKL